MTQFVRLTHFVDEPIYIDPSQVSSVVPTALARKAHKMNPNFSLDKALQTVVCMRNGIDFEVKEPLKRVLMLLGHKPTEADEVASPAGTAKRPRRS